ncbi:hypothetical protein [Roseibium aestuarii]|uniref:Uncharacterized protein n=1 Tax=Roseibium aestuarii TaxID=2600299 RepID=A0ABW4JW52_9HYPH|nr:hypothetical protein [Roseibium aestuarii]
MTDARMSFTIRSASGGRSLRRRIGLYTRQGALALAFLGALVVPAASDCTCRDRQGNDRDLGEVICLQVGGRMYLARCEMNQNMTVWKEVADGCPSAAVAPLCPAGDQARPLVQTRTDLAERLVATRL